MAHCPTRICISGRRNSGSQKLPLSFSGLYPRDRCARLTQKRGRPRRHTPGRRFVARRGAQGSVEADGQARRGHVALGLADGVVAEVEDRGGKHRSGAAVADAFDQVIERAHAA
jgi:hypothetical protein